MSNTETKILDKIKTIIDKVRMVEKTYPLADVLVQIETLILDYYREKEISHIGSPDTIRNINIEYVIADIKNDIYGLQLEINKLTNVINERQSTSEFGPGRSSYEPRPIRNIM